MSDNFERFAESCREEAAKETGALRDYFLNMALVNDWHLRSAQAAQRGDYADAIYSDRMARRCYEVARALI